MSMIELGERNRHSDWLRAGRPRGRSSSPARVKNYLFSASFRPAQGSTHPPIQWVLGGGGSKVGGETIPSRTYSQRFCMVPIRVLCVLDATPDVKYSPFS
jgi:hypothetical protein